MKNLGKIVFIFFLLQQSIFAGVVASVDAEHVGFGEVVTYNLTLSGEELKRPEIFTLCGEDVIGTGSSTSIQMINGDYEKNYILSYKFVPTKSCTIEPISVEIDGEKHNTESISIVVEKVTPSKDDDFFITLSSDKQEVYVGEAFELTLLFRQKKSAQVVDSKFVQPEFTGFWVKGEPVQEITKEPFFTNTKITYKMAPQREGNLYISPAQIGIATRKNTRNFYGGFFPEVKWKNYFSNDINITSKALPSGVNLVGDCIIEASVDRQEIHPNEAVNLTIRVQGDVNLEDIKSFKPYINGVSTFDEKIVIKDNLLTQKITFVADNSFTIPSFSLKLFNPQTEEITTVQTKEIEIQVKNAVAKKEKELTIKREEPIVEVAQKTVTKELAKQTLDTFVIVGIFIAGLALGIVIMLLKPLIVLKREKKLNLNDHKMLLVKLLPFKENGDVKELVAVLENNLYKEEKLELDKKRLKEIIKKYEIS